MASRERKPSQTEEKTKAEQLVKQVPKVQATVPQKGPAVKAVEDTVKAETEVKKGAALAQQISKSIEAQRQPERKVESPLPRPPARTEERKEPQRQEPEMKSAPLKPSPVAQEETKVVQAEARTAKLKTEKPVAVEERKAEGPKEAKEAKPPQKSAFRRMLDSFLSLFSRRPSSRKEPAPPKEGKAKAKEKIPIVVAVGQGKALSGPPPEEPGGYSLIPADSPIDLASVQVAQIDPDAGLAAQLPGLDAAQAASGQAALLPLRPTLTAYEARVRSIMARDAEAFRPVRRMRMGQYEISICRPIRMGDSVPDARPDVVVPVFVTAGGKTRLVVCYQSQSQGTWRRFAGCDNAEGHYYKGPAHGSENLQDLDWRIQKEIDFVAAHERPTLMPRTALREFGPLPADGPNGPRLVVEIENLIQASALSGARTLDLSQPGNMPARMVDYRIVGSDEDFYGRHACAVLESGDGRFLYGVALTDLGMFLQYVHDREAGQIIGGSPSRGVVVPDRDDWLLTPIIEYRSQTLPVLERRLSRVERRGSLVAGGYRSYLVGVHSSSGSPFFRLDNALSPLYPLLRSGMYDRAGAILEEFRLGARPLAVDGRPEPLPAETVAAMADARRRQLVAAFNARSARLLSDEEIMRRYSVSRRDLMVIGRYEEQWREQALGGQRLEQRITHRVHELDRILGRMRGRPIDRASRAGMSLVSRENLSEREIDALNSLAASGAAAGERRRVLTEAVRAVFRGEMSERLGWQATLWAQAEIAIGRAQPPKPP